MMAGYEETDTTTYAHSEHKGSDVLMSFLTPALQPLLLLLSQYLLRDGLRYEKRCNFWEANFYALCTTHTYSQLPLKKRQNIIFLNEDLEPLQ